MEIKPDEYNVIVISREKDAETSFLGKAGRADDEVWCYAAIGPNCSDKTISKPNKDDLISSPSYYFYLINAYCWECHNVHHTECSCNNNSNPSDKISRLLKLIAANGKKNIVWTHESDNISHAPIKTIFIDGLVFCATFHHSTPNHLVEDFMVKVCNNDQDNFQNKFKELIEFSLKKKSTPHLIALSILCQGYLAAHGDDDLIKELPEKLKKEDQDLIKGLPDELKNKVQTKDNKNKTKEKLWWTSALGKENQSTIEGELKAVPGDKDIKKEDVQKLITAIYTDGDPMPNGNFVAEAYDALKSILQGK